MHVAASQNWSFETWGRPNFDRFFPYPDLPCPPIYRAISLSPKRPGKSGFYCTCQTIVSIFNHQVMMILIKEMGWKWFKSLKIGDFRPSSTQNNNLNLDSLLRGAGICVLMLEATMCFMFLDIGKWLDSKSDKIKSWQKMFFYFL